MNFRGYTYVCVCGRTVRGQYAMAPLPPAGLGPFVAADVPPLDQSKAICQQARGKAQGQPRSTTDTHYVGCGRTLAESDAEREKQRELQAVQL